MATPKRPTYMRLSVVNIGALNEIAAQEDRSPGAMADILLGLGIEEYRRRQAEKDQEREAGT